jgi:hypothetical protein
LETNSFLDRLAEGIQDTVFGNGYIALGVVVCVLLVSVASRIFGGGRL